MSCQQNADKLQDLWRVATRILKPSADTPVLNYGLGSGEATIVAQGANLEQLGDVKSILKTWGLGKR
jgi:processing peptidase subunit alpha